MGISKNEKQLQFIPQRYLRRGVFSSVDLSNSIYSALPESVCVLRFPHSVAKQINALLNSGERFPFGIQPTPFEDFRIFDVHILDQDFVGILVDLPCNIEVYKSLDCESLFKSTNLSQMLYIYDVYNLPKCFLKYSNINLNNIYKGPMRSNMIYTDDCFTLFIKYLRDILHWEWPTGLLPATRSIRSRKYRNTELFDINEVIEAEQELLDRVSMPNQDMITIEVVSKKEMDEQLHLFKNEQKNSPFPISSVFEKKKKATCMGIIGKDDDLRSMITRFKKDDPQKKGKNNFEFDEIQSDISDVIFRESSDEEGDQNGMESQETITNDYENQDKLMKDLANKDSNDFSMIEEWGSQDSSSDF